MKRISIFNEVLGPVMRGPSSSHTAGAFHLGRMVRDLLGDEPSRAEFTFHTDGSFGKVYAQQGADLAFAMALLDLPLTDERFQDALEEAAEAGLDIRFKVENLPEADHPNFLRFRLASEEGRNLEGEAKSIGGGSVVITRIEGWPVRWDGTAHILAAELDPEMEPEVRDAARSLMEGDGAVLGQVEETTFKERIPDLKETTPDETILEERNLQEKDREGRALLRARRRSPLSPEARSELEGIAGVSRVFAAEPICFVKKGEPLFTSAEEVIGLAEQQGLSLGRAALRYESALLELTEEEVLAEMDRRLDVMLRAVQRGLEPDPPAMQLLPPSAGRIFSAEAKDEVALGGVHTRAAARAMAAMHVSGGMGVVCAAPTAGSAGVIPAVAATLLEDMGVSREQCVLALLAAGVVGVILAERATFAAEVAGCQVEIGAGGAMAAAAVVEAAGGSAAQAADAAAISFQNTMGSVCDLVQGIVEIPCHTRNAVAASGAFVCADLVLGGYENPIPLDETIDAVFAVGKMLPKELRCTALGGLAAAPSAKSLKRRR